MTNNLHRINATSLRATLDLLPPDCTALIAVREAGVWTVIYEVER